jgi:hypothetical protein
MLQALKHTIRKTFPNFMLQPEGEAGVRQAGHRKYIGGAWEEIGTLQFEFLRSQGMEPHHVLLDVACGSFRLGVKAIPYLEPGHYLGIEKEQALVDAGLIEEIGAKLAAEKRPEIVVSSAFEFERFSRRPDFAIAQSLFTHLTPELIDLCFTRLRPVMKPETRFFATWFLARPGFRNPAVSHDHGFFAYSQEEIVGFGARAGFRSRYIGNWGHPRRQVICEYTL